MNREDIIEGNKLLAKFMNFGNNVEGRISFLYSIGEEFPFSGNMCIPELCSTLIEQEVRDEIDEFGNCLEVEIYSFNSSWDWLLPVIGKISEQCEEPEELDDLRMALLCNDIDTAYEEVIDYIKYKQ